MNAPSSTVWNDQQRGHGNTGAWRTWMWAAVLNTGPSWARIRVATSPLVESVCPPDVVSSRFRMLPWQLMERVPFGCLPELGLA